MARVRIKFCGITNEADAQAAVVLGVDALGFVFYKESPRYVSRAQAAEIIRALPPLVTKVGLFVNATPQDVEQTIAATGIDLVQFHGDESADSCRRASRPWIKALRVRISEDVSRGQESYAEASALLLDAYDPFVFGGSGRAFDWGLLPRVRKMPLIVAGGLTPENVADAIRLTQPYAVDVSGGIEMTKGAKDHDKMRRFIREVQHVECQT